MIHQIQHYLVTTHDFWEWNDIKSILSVKGHLVILSLMVAALEKYLKC